MEPGTAAPRHTILVVDDEPASLRALQRTLLPEHRVLTAGDGEAGLAVLAAEPVSLIVTDHRMPGLSGVEMLARSRRSHPDAVRVVLTGYADLDALAEAINAGAVFYYLTKPWEPGELRLVVRRGLEHLEAEWRRRALMRDLEAACARAEREAEQKTRLLATAAHELGTPVHVLGNAVEMLAELPALRDCAWIESSERSLAWLRRSLSQMHTGFRLRAGMVRLEPVAVDLGASLAAALASIRTAATDRRLAFHLDAPPVLTVRGDPRWLRELWISLLSNAVRFTPDGGRIDVEAGGGDEHALVRIADDGIGMSPAQLAGAFEAFSTAAGDLLLHGSGRFEFGARGMGLGLAIARHVVELHGGEVEIDSIAGGGTTLAVRLPR